MKFRFFSSVFYDVILTVIVESTRLFKVRIVGKIPRGRAVENKLIIQNVMADIPQAPVLCWEGIYRQNWL